MFAPPTPLPPTQQAGNERNSNSTAACKCQGPVRSGSRPRSHRARPSLPTGVPSEAGALSILGRLSSLPRVLAAWTDETQASSGAPRCRCFFQKGRRSWEPTSRSPVPGRGIQGFQSAGAAVGLGFQARHSMQPGWPPSLPSRSTVEVSPQIKRLTVKFSFGLSAHATAGGGVARNKNAAPAPPRGRGASSEPSGDLMKVERNSFHVYSNGGDSPDAPPCAGAG